MQEVDPGIWGQVTRDEWQAADSGCHISCFMQDSVCRNKLPALTHYTAAPLPWQPLHLANLPCIRTPSDPQWPLISDRITDPDQGLISNLNKCPK